LPTADLSTRSTDLSFGSGRLVATKMVVHVADLAAELSYVEQRNPDTVAAVELGGVRTFVFVPLLKENELIGVLTVCRQEVTRSAVLDP
jgi:two-component system, NtrC family, sensor kinase